MDTEISDWADLHDTGTAIEATDRESGQKIGMLHYFFIEDDTIQFKDIAVKEKFTRRRVATAMLRYLNICHPDARINPGVRNAAGSEWMRHILETEKDKVATNGILNVPLRRMTSWPGFDLANAQRLAGASSD